MLFWIWLILSCAFLIYLGIYNMEVGRRWEVRDGGIQFLAGLAMALIGAAILLRGVCDF